MTLVTILISNAESYSDWCYCSHSVLVCYVCSGVLLALRFSRVSLQFCVYFALACSISVPSNSFPLCVYYAPRCSVCIRFCMWYCSLYFWYFFFLFRFFLRARSHVSFIRLIQRVTTYFYTYNRCVYVWDCLCVWEIESAQSGSGETERERERKKRVSELVCWAPLWIFRCSFHSLVFAEIVQFCRARSW